MERMRTEHLARAAGLPTHTTPSLGDVDRRRSQLWLLALLAVLTLPIGMIALTADAVGDLVGGGQDVWRLRLLLLAMLVAVLGYVASLERTLRALTARLVEERALSAALAHRVDEWALLLDASRAMNESLDLPAVLARILQAASAVTGAAGGSVQLVADDDDGALEVAAVHGASPAPIGHRQRIGEGLAGAVAATREGRLLHGPQPGSERAIDSALVTPLLHREELVGVLNLDVGTAGRPFTPNQQHVVGVLAETAAVAIVNARTHAALRASRLVAAPR